MTTAEDVRSEAKGYIIFIVLVPILGASAYMLDGIFVGAMKTKDMRNMMFISLIFYFLALILLVPHFENIGLWLALLISFVVRGVTLALRAVLAKFLACLRFVVAHLICYTVTQWLYRR